MSERQVLLPSESHPIHINQNPRRVVVKLNGETIADSYRVLTLKEASYPAVQYIPLEDVDESVLVKTDHQTYCPYKGECSYYSLITSHGTLENVVWTYETPYDSVAEIKDHVAFYPNRVDSIEESDHSLEELSGLP